jgi:hypothetical protein
MKTINVLRRVFGVTAAVIGLLFFSSLVECSACDFAIAGLAVFVLGAVVVCREFPSENWQVDLIGRSRHGSDLASESLSRDPLAHIPSCNPVASTSWFSSCLEPIRARRVGVEDTCVPQRARVHRAGYGLWPSSLPGRYLPAG